MMRVLGMVLRLVGVSSPEDIQAKKKNAEGLPSWRKPEKPGSPETKDQKK
jgi:hypothetical protein